MSRKPRVVSQERVRELLNYDPASGLFWRKVATRGYRQGTLAGSVNVVTGYVCICIDRINYQAHRVAWLYMMGEMPHRQIDHRNGNRLDNRFNNLRLADNQQNGANSRVRVGNYKGVHWHSQISRWRARICVDGKSISLGCYDSEREAALAYDAGAQKYFGEFARTNFGAPDV